MPEMEHRLQLLLDRRRYERVAREARASGRSVAAVIREAIDARYFPGGPERAAALQEFLGLSESPQGRGEGWADIKHDLEAELSRGLP